MRLFAGELLYASVRKDKLEKNLVLLSADNGRELSRYISFHQGSEALGWPGAGECLLNSGLAGDLKLKAGDPLTLVIDEKEYTLTISGIFDNYIYNYVVISDDTYQSLTGEAPEKATAYVLRREEAADATARFLSSPGVINVSAGSVLKDRIGSIMDNLIYIVILVVYSVIVFTVRRLRYAKAKRKVDEFYDDLTELQDLYRFEDIRAGKK